MARAERSSCAAWRFVPHAPFGVIHKDGHLIFAVTGRNRPIHARLSASLGEAMRTARSVCPSATQPPASQETRAQSRVCSGVVIQVLRASRAQGRRGSPAPGRVQPRGSHVTRPRASRNCGGTLSCSSCRASGERANPAFTLEAHVALHPDHKEASQQGAVNFPTAALSHTDSSASPASTRPYAVSSC